MVRTRLMALTGVFSAVLAAAVCVAAPAHALLFIGGGGSMGDGPVGSSVAGAFGVSNSSTSPEDGFPVQFVGMDLYPSCFTTAGVAASDCSNGTVEPDGFELQSPVGHSQPAGNATCNGSWTVTEAAPGRWRFVPPGGEGTLLLNANDICEVSFNALVLNVPMDVDASAPGAQTYVATGFMPVLLSSPPQFNHRRGDGFRHTVTPAPGTLRVTTSPSVPSQISVDGVPRHTYGIIGLPLDPGSHQVCFSHVEGFTEPACQNATITAGQSTSLQGSFTPRGVLRVVTSPAAPGTIVVDGTPRADWGMWTDLPTGLHDVCFGPIANMAPPPCRTIPLAAGAPQQVTVSYTNSPGAPGAVGLGLLWVVTSPSVPSQITIDGEIADTFGVAFVKLPPGPHQVCFSALEGFTAPGCQSATVNAGAVTTATGTFVRRGFLQVQTSPAVGGAISLDGVARDTWGLFTDFATGPHQVCFGPVAGRIAPPCQNVNLMAGSTTSVTGVYSPA